MRGQQTRSIYANVARRPSNRRLTVFASFVFFRFTNSCVWCSRVCSTEIVREEMDRKEWKVMWERQRKKINILPMYRIENWENILSWRLDFIAFILCFDYFFFFSSIINWGKILLIYLFFFLILCGCDCCIYSYIIIVECRHRWLTVFLILLSKQRVLIWRI